MANEYTGESFAVRNPRSGVADYRFSAPAVAELHVIADGLRAAQVEWAARPVAERMAVLDAWQKALAQHADAIVSALAADTGRGAISRSECASVGSTIERCLRTVRALPELPQDQPSSVPGISFGAQLVPYPLVGVISPWNFPLALAVIDAIPALLAGCAVLVKPSEVTPRFAEPLMASIRAVPELAAVLFVQPGGREMGETLVGLADMICFTGSVRTGRMVAENAARNFIPACLELGGNDPVIVTASAHVESASDIVLRASCLATGQACQSLERVYVDRTIHDQFLQRLIDKARQIEINWPDMTRGVLGPFIWERQAAIVADQIADATGKGATLQCGGRIIDHGGKWLEPTVLSGVNHNMQLMREETFGPVMPVMAYDHIEEAIRLANEGSYGLSAAVIAGSLDEAGRIGRQIDAGGISLNDGALTGFVHEAEKNSFKLSGLGPSRMGAAGYLRFFRRKALLRQHGTAMSLAAMAEQPPPPA
ncbi:MAG: aldehyde dehydrogenase family protein [Steroidobacteraceae bacterium]